MEELVLGYFISFSDYFALKSKLEYYSWKVEVDCGQRETDVNRRAWLGGYGLTAGYKHPSVGHWEPSQRA